MKRKVTKKAKGANDQELIRFGISIPANLIKKFDEHLAGRNNQNRSEAIRDLIRDRLVQESWNEGRGDQVATVTLVYDSQSTEFQRRLIESKRELGDNLLSCMLVRLGSVQELEVLVLRGSPSAIRAQAENILGMKGVLHGKIVMTTSSTP